MILILTLIGLLNNNTYSALKLNAMVGCTKVMTAIWNFAGFVSNQFRRKRGSVALGFATEFRQGRMRNRECSKGNLVAAFVCFKIQS